MSKISGLVMLLVIGFAQPCDGGDRSCTGTEVAHHDGSFESACAWSYGGETGPYYGAFGEAYSLGDVQLTCASFWFTESSSYTGQNMDVYVWDGGVMRAPGAVLAMVPGVDPGEVATWPTWSRHDVEIDVHVTDEFTVGYWGNWPGAPNGWWVGADMNGAGYSAWTMVAPGIGYPSDWQYVGDIPGYSGIVALGIGVTWVAAPQGACCDPETGSCALMGQSQCSAPLEWSGAPSCDPNPCAAGVCCFVDGRCEIHLQSACDGDWQGPGGACLPNPCPQPLGACCHEDASCNIGSQAQCMDMWLGSGTGCEPNPCPPPGQQTLYVDPSGSPSTFPWFPNIQAALAYPNLQPWDEILLMDGIFTGAGNRNINFLGRAVTVRSASGNPAACIVDGGGYSGNAGGFGFGSGETRASVLQDITIRNHWKNLGTGAGIGITGASPTIRNCRIVGNVADGFYGGGIYCSSSSARFVDCLITGNAAGGYHNMGGGGGIFAVNSNLILENCTIAGNMSAGPEGGGFVLDSATIVQSIIWGNCGGYDPQIENHAIFTCCDVGFTEGGGIVFDGPQVHADPLFCAPVPCGNPNSGGDYSLQASSPCWPEVSPCGSLIGALLGCETSGVDRETGGSSELTGTVLQLRIQPNPTSGVIRYRFALPRETVVRATLYDAGGRLVRDSGEARFGAGSHDCILNARPGESPSLPAGVYYLRLEAGKVSKTAGLVLIQ